MRSRMSGSMSGEGKRSVAAWPKLPRLSSTLQSMDDVYAKLEDAALYIERNPELVKSITSFPYITRSI